MHLSSEFCSYQKFVEVTTVILNSTLNYRIIEGCNLESQVHTLACKMSGPGKLQLKEGTKASDPEVGGTQGLRGSGAQRLTARHFHSSCRKSVWKDSPELAGKMKQA